MNKSMNDLIQLATESDMLGQMWAMLDLLPEVSFFLKDRQGNFVTMNRAGWEYCGVKSAGEAYQRGDYDFFPPERASLYIADDQQVMKTGKPIIRRVEPAPEMEGSPQLVETTKLPIRDASGKSVGLIGFHRPLETKQHFTQSLDKFCETVEHMHLSATSHLCIKDLAQRAGLSESGFTRIFRAKIGISPLQYIKRVRVELACRLLLKTEDTVTSIAHECGFYDHAHFTRAFKSSMGMNPSEYRKERNGG